jgi:hypothetical protein
MIYLHTIFEIPISSGFFFIVMKPKAKENFRTAARLLYGKLREDKFKIYYHTTFQDTKLRGASVTPTSQVRASTLLLLLFVGN